ncbi:MAG: hypothetical protein ACU84J_15965, partial [Gammaproteobacteria bacterium]
FLDNLRVEVELRLLRYLCTACRRPRIAFAGYYKDFITSYLMREKNFLTILNILNLSVLQFPL